MLELNQAGWNLICFPNASGTDHALSQSDESPRAQDFRDSNDPMHPFTKMVLQHTLPPHVFACPTASQPNASESNKLLESTKPGASGSPATPMLEAQVHVHDPCTLETSPTGGVKPVNNGFQFPTPPGQDCTPILNTRHQLEYDAACNRNGHSNGNGMLPCGDTGPDGGCESRGMSTVKRKRPDVDYSLLAGRTVMPSTNNTAGKRKPPKSATGSQAEVNTNPTLLAVQNAVAAGMLFACGINFAVGSLLQPTGDLIISEPQNLTSCQPAV